MRVKFLRVLLILVSVAIVNFAFADQKIKTKSNIKNDRVQQPATNVDCSSEASTGDCVKPEEGTSVTDVADADLKKSQQMSSSSSDSAKETSSPQQKIIGTTDKKLSGKN